MREEDRPPDIRRLVVGALGGLLFGQPVMASIIVMSLLFGMALFDGFMSTVLAIAAVMWGVAAIAVAMRGRADDKVSWHHALEGRAGIFTVLVVIGVLVGGVAEIIPMVISVPEIDSHHQERPVHAARARRPRRFPPGGLLHLPLADDPPVHLGNRALRRRFRRWMTRSSTIRSSGARAASARTWRASAASTRTSGTTST